MSDDLRYPIGRFRRPSAVSDDDLRSWIDAVACLPSEVRRASEGLDPRQLDTPYRDGGWSTRQIVHHLADSHMNSLIRFRLALTEDAPTIRPYDQDAWAGLADGRSAEIEPSLAILSGVHARWAVLLKSFGSADWARAFVHPQAGRTIRLDVNLALYAWHGRHHVAQIERLRERHGW